MYSFFCRKWVGFSHYNLIGFHSFPIKLNRVYSFPMIYFRDFRDYIHFTLTVNRSLFIFYCNVVGVYSLLNLTRIHIHFLLKLNRNLLIELSGVLALSYFLLNVIRVPLLKSNRIVFIISENGTGCYWFPWKLNSVRLISY